MPTVIGIRDSSGYSNHFEETKSFFKDRLGEGVKKSVELIERLSKK
jgi:hypothetical protein